MFFTKQVALTKGVSLTVLVLLVFSYIQLIAGEYVFLYSIIGAVTVYILFVDLKYNKVNIKFAQTCAVLMFLYVLQYTLFRAADRVTTSFLDPNISGYYLFLAYSVFRFGNLKFFAAIALVAGVFSLSRNFYLAVFIFEVVRLNLINKTVGTWSTFKSPYLIASISILVMVLFSVIMLGMSEVNATMGDSSARLININDGSNYSRAKANIDMLERLAEGEFFFIGNGDGVDTRTEHRPHNAFLRAIYRYGVLTSFATIFVSLYVMRFVSEKTYPLFIAVFAYYTFLNDFITGPEIVLLLSVSAIGAALSSNVERRK
jgi:hypothetical protein